ncbi:PREDICTED: YLP motif-containing protein 1-like isoform X2 [Nicrophorus vespilloides]|uniref:YLP motif-containing protein 1-like isoform X2 n=1 Tax=Nicrophorus vespilloides TaxID=110193 RepID=A0ABM1NJK6_NICVS|nr:PREDICTED: YLP motif-containing protein 1-like isoform X2 [Nicrophorus vespilloides]XP_017787006.1 PREDICTED: YLP motif-containing protein 1-like isoform X2 [Nicrophorus vespilloides]
MSWPQWQGNVSQGVGALPLMNAASGGGTATPSTAMGIQYTQEQWQQVQQQNWQQWAQWQQQYQQWHQQYGAEYQKTLSAMTSQVQTTSAPPPLPQEMKQPPLPPPEEHTTNVYQVKAVGGGYTGYTTAPPPKPPTGYSTEQPWKQHLNDKPEMGTKRPYSTQSNYHQEVKRNKFEQNWQQQVQTNAPPPPPPQTATEDLSESEKKFMKQFAEWEAQFNKWKEQNQDHPDKAQYKEYEKKWEAWRNQLLDRREQMRKRRLGTSDAKTTFVPNVSKPPPNINNEPLQFKPKPMDYHSYPHTSTSNNQEDVNLFSTGTLDGIPGLDLVGTEVDDQRDKDVVVLDDVPKPKGPDLEALSKNINSILGDQKLLNMLSLVTKNMSKPLEVTNPPPPIPFDEASRSSFSHDDTYRNNYDEGSNNYSQNNFKYDNFRDESNDYNHDNTSTNMSDNNRYSQDNYSETRFSDNNRSNSFDNNSKNNSFDNRSNNGGLDSSRHGTNKPVEDVKRQQQSKSESIYSSNSRKESPAPPPKEDDILIIENVVNYDHKTKKTDFEVNVEPPRLFDYRHKSVNRIPLPERPKWLHETFKNIVEFEPSIVKQPYCRYPPPPADRYDYRSHRYDGYDSYNSRNRYEERRFEPSARYNRFPQDEQQVANRQHEDYSRVRRGGDHDFEYRGRESVPPPKSNTEKSHVEKQHVTLIDDVLNPPGRFRRPPRIVIILRGPSGSGKTFLAKLIKDREVENGGSAPRILSLDDYFMVEQEREVTEDGKKIKVKEMVYEYEECMELSYRTSLLKSFKKTITDGYFPFIVVDNMNDKVKYFSEMWSFAKQNGFQVYVCQLELDVQLCSKRNTHNRSLLEIENTVAEWEETPVHYATLDATNLIQAGSIPEVEMEEIDSPNDNFDDMDVEGEEQACNSSKWDNFECSINNLAKLDGTSKPLRHAGTMEDYLQLDDGWAPKRGSIPGQKRKLK